MQRGHCAEGSKLYLLYKQQSMELLGIETYKRHAVAGATREEWREISNRVEAARAAYEEARRNYVDHEIECDVCEKDVPAFYFLGSTDHPVPKEPNRLVRN